MIDAKCSVTTALGLVATFAAGCLADAEGNADPGQEANMCFTATTLKAE
jgi:uncharacterized membrane protein (DUF4010 family)